MSSFLIYPRVSASSAALFLFGCHYISKEREVLIDFPGRDLAVVRLPFAGLELDEFFGDHPQPRADDGIRFQFVDRFGQRLRKSLNSALGDLRERQFVKIAEVCRTGV